MTDDRMDDLIRDLARDYNAPAGNTPRERMWHAIEATRAHARAAAVGRRPWWSRGWIVPALAAAALVMIGIGIGRRLEESRPRLAERQATPGRTLAAKPEAARNPANTQPSASIDSTVAVARAPRTSRQLAITTARAGVPPTTNNDEAIRALAGRMVVLDQLAGTEAMLTSFRAEARTGKVDAQLTAWARNLLATTRTLRTTTAASDPTMQRLLDDLELVLVQIAQYTSGSPHHAEELDLIDQAIERHGVIGRLRTLPAGPISGT